MNLFFLKISASKVSVQFSKSWMIENIGFHATSHIFFSLVLIVKVLFLNFFFLNNNVQNILTSIIFFSAWIFMAKIGKQHCHCKERNILYLAFWIGLLAVGNYLH